MLQVVQPFPLEAVSFGIFEHPVAVFLALFPGAGVGGPVRLREGTFAVRLTFFPFTCVLVAVNVFVSALPVEEEVLPLAGVAATVGVFVGVDAFAVTLPLRVAGEGSQQHQDREQGHDAKSELKERVHFMGCA